VFRVHVAAVAVARLIGVCVCGLWWWWSVVVVVVVAGFTGYRAL
jgi:hypothetical protein